MAITVAVSIAVGLAVATGWGDADRLAPIREIRGNGLGDVAYRADLDYRGLGLLQDQLFVDGADLGLFLVGLLATGTIFFRGGLRNVVFQVADTRGVFGVDFQGVFIGVEINLLALGVDLVLAVGLVPLGDGRVLVHVFDDFAPADAGVVRAEGNFALLCGIRDDAHLGAAGVVVEQILEPHAGDEQEVPRVGLAALHGVFVGAIRRRLAVFLLGILGECPSLVKLLEEVVKREALRSLESLVILEERQSHHEVGEGFAARSVGDGGNVPDELLRVEEARNRRPFLGFLVDHDRRADAAIGVAAARESAPLRIRAVDQIGETSEGGDERDGEPVAGGFHFADLAADVLRQMRKGVALAEAALRSNVFVAASEGNRLEADEGDFLWVFHREFHDGADLVVVDVVHDGDDQHDFDAGFVHVLDGAQLDIKQVADLAMPVGVVADAVELQVGGAHAGFKGLLGELLALGEFDAVGGGLHAVVANLAGISDRFEEVRAHGGLAAGELHGHLAARLDAQSVVQDFLYFVPAQLVDVANLVGVHEAGVAHHVAAVGEVDSEHGTAAIAHGAGTVLVKIFVVVGGNIAAGELLLDVVEEFGVDGHHVFVVAVDGAVFDHPNFAVAFDNLRFDLADLLVHEVAPVFFAVNDGFAGFFDAIGTERIGLPRPAEGWLGLFPGL